MTDTDSLKRRANLAEVIRSYGIDLKKQGSKLFAHCPFHADSTPSFSVYRHPDGIERCGCKGCGFDGDVLDFIQRREGTDFKASVARLEELYPAKPRRNVKPGKMIATYDYTDASGDLIFQVVRRELLDAETGEVLNQKHFSQRRPKSGGGWEWNLSGVTRELYRLPFLGGAATVWIVEGEKDVHSLEACGVAATTNAGGASAPWLTQYTDALRGKHVILCGDSDAPGQERDARIAVALHGAAASIRLVHLPPGLCKDITDWLEAGQTLDALLSQAIPFRRRESVPAAEPPPKPSSTELNSRGGDWREHLLYNHLRNPKPSIANVMIALRMAPEWSGVLWYSEFSGGATARRRFPGFCHDVPAAGIPWRDSHDILLTEWLHHQGIVVSTEIAGKAVQAVAEEMPFHPVREYLSSLEWDAMPRLDNWLIEYLGIEASNYAATVGPKWLISAVARVFEPGCKADCCLILEGEQGIRKSTALKTLANPWFADEIADIGSKDSAIQTQGVWVVEISELDAMRKAEVSRIKAFMSRSTDRFRPPYGKRAVEFQRQCVFAATTNQDSYFHDETGNRRFWPVRCREQIDTAELARVRDQLWAEAVVRYREHAPWWLEDRAMIADAEREQRKRYELDPWHERIEEYLEARGDVSVTQILDHCLVKPARDWTQQDRSRVGRVLRAMRWQRVREWEGSTRGEYRWKRSDGGGSAVLW